MMVALAELTMEQKTLTGWKLYSEKNDKVPKLEELLRFAEQRMDVLPSEEPDKTIQKPPKQHKVNTTITKFTKEYSTTPKGTCKMCSSTSHAIYLCPDFKEIPVGKRTDFVRKNHLCYNCLAYGHAVMHCRNTMTCRHCCSRHHHLLNQEKDTEQTTVNATVANLNTADSSTPFLIRIKIGKQTVFQTHVPFSFR